MNIEGVWNARYSLEQQQPFVNQEGEPDEVAKGILMNGQIAGLDPWGGFYKGQYSLQGNLVSFFITVSSYEEGTEPIFEGLNYPLNITLEGEFNSPDYFSMKGHVVESPSNKIVLNLERIE